MSRGVLITIALLAAALFAGALALSAWVFITSHNQADQSRREGRAATVLLGRAVCAENSVLEQAVLTDGQKRTKAELARINAFFAKFNAPVNQALSTLGAPPCEKGS